ncbi:MAG: SGNH/GDSL hydrolase family protein [Verrucomicrobiota bacterium]
MKISRFLWSVSAFLIFSTLNAFSAEFELKNGVIHFFENSPPDVRIVHQQVGTAPLWINAVRKDGKTHQIRLLSLPTDQKPATVRFEYPFGDASATWNLPIRREGSVVVADVPWNGTLIGDRLDPNEGDEAARAARKKLGVAGQTQHGLPVVYSSGDSISLGYWPYLEAELGDTADLYYQRELTKDHPQIVISNNGVAELAHGVLAAAYKYDDFKPRYVIMNFGLHMISRVAKNPEEYGRWIVKCDELTKQHGSRLIWLTTTPYQKGKRDPDNKVIDTFNALAVKIAGERNIPVIDLHAFVTRELQAHPPADVYSDGVHFTEAAKRGMGQFIGQETKALMKKDSAAKK